VLFHISQEALANIAKHAKAKQVDISLWSSDERVLMEIHDNGKSFDLDRVLFAKRHKRLGLLGSRERVEMVGGVFNVSSAPGKGTTVSAEIPVVTVDAQGS